MAEGTFADLHREGTEPRDLYMAAWEAAPCTVSAATLGEDDHVQAAEEIEAAGLGEAIDCALAMLRARPAER